MFPARTYLTTEIKAGLVLWLSPADLAQSTPEIASVSATLSQAGLGPHYFLVLDREGDTVAITQLTSHPNGPGWLPLEGKSGNALWLGRPTFHHPNRVWPPVTVAAVIAAARAGGDPTRQRERNWVDGKHLEQVVASLPRPANANSAGATVPGELFWRLYWASYRRGEIWTELRMSSVVLAAKHVRFVTGRP